MLLYPVYTLLFADTGLSVGQISSLFVLWSAATLLLEVPSGAWADSTSRRRLVAFGPLLTAVTFALWVSAPGYWVFALGFVLWGLKTALVSGALEALVYEDLQYLDATDRYAAMMGRAEATGVLAAMCSGAVAAPVLAGGGYAAVGVASVAVSVIAAATALLFPEHRAVVDDDDETELVWTAALRSGLGEARRSRRVRSAVILVVGVAAVAGALDEYAPLLVRSFGVDDVTVSLLMVAVWAGSAAGGLLAGRWWQLGNRALACLIAGGAIVLGISALSGHPAGVIGLGIGFGALHLVTVIADTRLQHSITGPARATVTSLAGMSTDVVTVGVYGVYTVAALDGHATAFAVLMLPYLVTAVWLSRAGRRSRAA